MKNNLKSMEAIQTQFDELRSEYNLPISKDTMDNYGDFLSTSPQVLFPEITDNPLTENEMNFVQTITSDPVPEGFSRFYSTLQNCKDMDYSSFLEPIDSDPLYKVDSAVMTDKDAESEMISESDLVARLTHPTMGDPSFLKTFLLTYTVFMDSPELMRLLLLRACVTPKEGTNIVQFRRSIQLHVQIRVVNVLLQWMEHYYEPKLDHLPAKIALSFFNNRSLNLNETLVTKVRRLLESRSALGRAGPRAIKSSDTQPPPIYSPGDVITLQFLHPLEIARQMTIISQKMYRKIPQQELAELKFASKNKEILAPHILAMTRLDTAISLWVAATLLDEQNLQARAGLISKFIDIAENCLNLNNYAGAISCTAGLAQSAVNRLKDTWALVSEDRLKTFREILSLKDINFKAYRSRIKEAVPPGIPYIGILMTDRLFIDEGNPDRVDGSINLVKMRLLAENVEEFLRFKNVLYSLEVVAPIQTFLRGQIENAKNVNEDALYVISLKLQPRTRNAAPSTSNIDRT
jgi:hypothetical protein